MTAQLERIAKEIAEGQPSPRVSVREFLSWYGAQRRGYWISWSIRRELEKLGLSTRPNFESAYIDAPIEFELIEPEVESAGDRENSDGGASEPQPETPSDDAAKDPIQVAATDDPTYRISKLAAANQQIVSIAPNGSLGEAVALLMSNDFSQLPVMTSDRDVKGIVTWKSIGRHLALSDGAGEAREVMIAHKEIRADASIFEAIPVIINFDYVLVRGSDNRIVGIITASDLSQQFLMTAEPFLLLGEIENMLREIIDAAFDAADLAVAKDPSDSNREIKVVSDSAFGEYIRLLDNDERWKKLNLALDRKTFCQALEKVRSIRNDVMHFDPDGIPEKDLARLRDCANFLKDVRAILRAE